MKGKDIVYQRALKHACTLLAIASGAEIRKDTNKEDHIMVSRLEVEKQLETILEPLIKAEHEKQCTDPFVCMNDQGKIYGCTHNINKATIEAVWQVLNSEATN